MNGEKLPASRTQQDAGGREEGEKVIGASETNYFFSSNLLGTSAVYPLPRRLYYPSKADGVYLPSRKPVATVLFRRHVPE